MTDSATTPFSNRCSILAELWLEYKNDSDFSDFIEYNDLGLPLAYAISSDIVKVTDIAESFVNETWDLFLEVLGLQDEGFESMADIMIASGKILP